ncbi:hypothetical protein E2C01_038812 [Portunus trituberculatus]|uniref:Uncharacterized protein n=1 Tax=Portunus trituberculatus TaxID=210409 RepID=A0A5B7FHX0_PORTR|nr:hypothetical protein [Portunus trituberculatus]
MNAMFAHLPHHKARRDQDVESRHGDLLQALVDLDNTLLTGTRKARWRRVALVVVVAAMAAITSAEVAVLAAHQVKMGGSALVVGACIGVALVFPVILLVGWLRLLLGHLLLAQLVAVLLTYGQLLWFRLLTQLQVPMQAMQHVMAGYLVLKVTLSTAIFVLAGTAPRCTYAGG